MQAQTTDSTARLIRALIAQHEPSLFKYLGEDKGLCGCKLSKSCKGNNKHQYRCHRCKIVVCTSCRYAHSLFHLETILRKLGVIDLLNTRLDEVLKNDVDGIFDGEEEEEEEEEDEDEDAEPASKKPKTSNKSK